MLLKRLRKYCGMAYGSSGSHKERDLAVLKADVYQVVEKIGSIHADCILLRVQVETLLDVRDSRVHP